MWLKYISDDNKIVQLHNENETIEDREKYIHYVLADRMSISGYINDTSTYNLENATELNELLLEQDIPIRFSESELDTI